jgi:hypothetical protein
MSGKLYSTKEKSKNELFSKKLKGEVIRVARGVYATSEYYDLLEVYSLRYSYAIFTLNTMFSIYGMTDRFIDKYHLVTKQGSRTIYDKRVVQYRQNSDLFNIGKIELNYNGINIAAYDKERLLIELFRFSNKIPRRLYKEVINYYRSHLKKEFRVHIYQEYCEKFNRDKDMLRESFRREVQ